MLPDTTPGNIVLHDPAYAALTPSEQQTIEHYRQNRQALAQLDAQQRMLLAAWIEYRDAIDKRLAEMNQVQVIQPQPIPAQLPPHMARPLSLPTVHQQVHVDTHQPQPFYGVQPLPMRPIDPRTYGVPEPRYGMDNLTRYCLLGMGGLLVFGLLALMLRPAPVPVVQPAQPTPAPRYPVYERDCRPAGLFGLNQECSERRHYVQ